MRTEQLEYFMTVVQLGSFSKAADAVGIKQQSVREAINSLEEELGVTLFHRSPHGVSLTSEGEVYLEDFREMMGIYQRIQERAKQAKTTVKQKVRIGFNTLVGQQIQGKMNQLYDSTPEFDLQLLEFPLGNDALQGVLRGECDLSLTSVTELILKQEEYVSASLNQELMFKPIKKMRFGIYVRPDHPLAFRKSVDMEELKAWPVSVHSKAIVSDYINVILKEKLQDVMVSSAPQMHHSRMERNQGVVVAPENIDWSEGVKFIPFSNQVPLMFGVFYTRAFTKDPALMELLNCIAMLMNE